RGLVAFVQLLDRECIGKFFDRRRRTAGIHLNNNRLRRSQADADCQKARAGKGQPGNSRLHPSTSPPPEAVSGSSWWLSPGGSDFPRFCEYTRKTLPEAERTGNCPPLPDGHSVSRTRDPVGDAVADRRSRDRIAAHDIERAASARTGGD